MPRKLRLEYPGAIYHVINRGNYREDIFSEDRTKMAFEACLFETCEKSAWLLHSFIVMDNHFHFGLETPEANLVAGMHWLEGTFANRFNHFRKEHGHLFQGRYKAILVEDGKPLGEVCDYIHLNPVKAHVVEIDRLLDCRYSSYWYLHHPKERPNFMKPQTALACAGGLPDNPQGWADYADRLALQAEELARMPPAERKCQEQRLTRRWVIGSDLFRAALIKDHNLAASTRAWESSGATDIRFLKWNTTLQRGLQALGRTSEDLKTARKSAPWKVALAVWVKDHTQATNRWLAQNLNLGVPTGLSRYVANYRLRFQQTDPLWKKLTATSST